MRPNQLRRMNLVDENNDGQTKASFDPRASSPVTATRSNHITPGILVSAAASRNGPKREDRSSLLSTDPLDALGAILDEDGSLLEHDGQGSPDSELHARVSNVPFGGASLLEFINPPSTDTSNPYYNPKPRSNAEVGYGSTQGLQSHTTMHQSINNCDRLLESVQNSLANLQKDLGTVAADIETLQSRSHEINLQLSRRKAVERLLGPALEDVSIPPTVVLKLAEDPIDRDWVLALADLDRRMHTHHEAAMHKHQPMDSNLTSVLESLKYLSIERIRDFFALKIRALRAPKVNAQALQQQAFLPFVDLFAFLSKYHPQLAGEIMQAYSNTMRWYYLTTFGKYGGVLEAVSVLTFSKQDVLGVEASNSKVQQPSPQTSQRASTPFLLGRRASILSHETKNAIPSQVIANLKKAVNLEVPFYSLTVAVTENASAEYAFLSAFLPSTFLPSALSQLFHTIYEPTFDIARSFTRYISAETTDCLGLLLCIRIMQQHAFTSQRKKCPVTEAWVNSTTMILWPRFQGAMDANIASLRKATMSLSAGSRTALSLTLGRGDDSKASIAPTPITQQFGQLLEGILELSSLSEADDRIGSFMMMSIDSEPVVRSLERLRREFEAFLDKVSKGISQSRRNKFLSNNYSLIKTIVGDHSGSLAREQLEWIEDRLEGPMA